MSEVIENYKGKPYICLFNGEWIEESYPTISDVRSFIQKLGIDESLCIIIKMEEVWEYDKNTKDFRGGIID